MHGVGKLNNPLSCNLKGAGLNPAVVSNGRLM